MELIVACTENNVIGNNGDMPWHLPADLQHFKTITTNNTIVMGRKTWESIGRALPNRCNIVVTRQTDYVAEGATVINTIEDISTVDTIGTVFIIGGGELYRLTVPNATKLHVTRIHTVIEGDTTFPVFDKNKWKLEHSTFLKADENNPFDVTFETWSLA